MVSILLKLRVVVQLLKAGLRTKDVIVKVDNKPVSDVASLHKILYSHKVGDTVDVTVNRNGSEKTVKVKLQGN